MTMKTQKIAIIGLGYVGLPLAVEFGKQFDTLGFDINTQRIADLRNGKDHTLETTPEELAHATWLQFTTDPAAPAVPRYLPTMCKTPSAMVSSRLTKPAKPAALKKSR